MAAAKHRIDHGGINMGLQKTDKNNRPGSSAGALGGRSSLGRGWLMLLAAS